MLATHYPCGLVSLGTSGLPAASAVADNHWGALGNAEGNVEIEWERNLTGICSEKLEQKESCCVCNDESLLLYFGGTDVIELGFPGELV